MAYEQNFRDRIVSLPSQPEPELKHASAEGQGIVRLLNYTFNTPWEEFDADGTRDKLNDLIKDWIELDPKEAIGMVEAFMDMPEIPREAISMLIGNFLYQLYKKFMPDAF